MKIPTVNVWRWDIKAGMHWTTTDYYTSKADYLTGIPSLVQLTRIPKTMIKVPINKVEDGCFSHGDLNE